MTVRRPSAAKIKRAERIALRTSQTIPDATLGSARHLSAWIRAHDPAPKSHLKLIDSWIASGRIEAPEGYNHAIAALEAKRIISEIEPARVERKKPPAKRGSKVLRRLLWAWLLIGMVPLLFPLLLLSTQWAASMGMASLAIGLVSALTYFQLLRHLVEEDRSFRIIVVGAAFLAFVAGRNIALFAAPMVLALFAGSQIDLQYKVFQTDGFGGKGCRSPIKLEGLPFLFSSICGFPESFRKSLAPGMHIDVEGYGTSYGIFVRDARPAIAAPAQ